MQDVNDPTYEADENCWNGTEGHPIASGEVRSKVIKCQCGVKCCRSLSPKIRFRDLISIYVSRTI